MIEFLIKNLPAIYVITPFFVAIFIIMLGDRFISRTIILFCNLFLLALAIIGFKFYDSPIIYNFGDWESPIGIEFKYNMLSSFILIFLSLINFLWSLFSFTTIHNLENLLVNSRKNFLYALIAIVHGSYAGLVLTNDLFNLYVFIEICALATYALIAISYDKKSYIASFEYLILGTIAATFILIGVGFILSAVGSLNIDHVHEIILNSYNMDKKIYNILSVGSIFIIVGALVKIAMFPLHNWQIKAYVYSSPLIASILASFSSFVAMIIIIKLYHPIMMHFISNKIYYLSYIGCVALVYSGIKALTSDSLRKILVYSSISQVGLYIILISSLDSSSFSLVFLSIIVDSLSKLGILFFIFSITQKKSEFLLKDLAGFSKSYPYLTIFFTLLIYNSAGLPLTYLFANKLNILIYSFFNKNFIISLIISFYVLISVLYYLRILGYIFRESEEGFLFKINRFSFSMIIVLSLTLSLMLFFYKDITSMTHEIYREFNVTTNV